MKKLSLFAILALTVGTVLTGCKPQEETTTPPADTNVPADTNAPANP